MTAVNTAHWMSIDEAAETLNVSRQRIVQLVEAERLREKRDGRRRWINRADVRHRCDELLTIPQHSGVKRARGK